MLAAVRATRAPAAAKLRTRVSGNMVKSPFRVSVLKIALSLREIFVRRSDWRCGNCHTSSLVCYWHIADIDFDAANVCFLGQADMTLGLSPCQLLTQSGPALTMRTARPTTGSPLSVSESGTAPFDPASSCFGFFRRLNPADPFIAREGPNVLPRLQRFCVGGQRFF